MTKTKFRQAQNLLNRMEQLKKIMRVFEYPKEESKRQEIDLNELNYKEFVSLKIGIDIENGIGPYLDTKTYRNLCFEIESFLFEEYNKTKMEFENL